MLLNTYFLIPNFKEDISLLIVKNLRYLKIDSLEYQQILDKIKQLKFAKSKVYDNSEVTVFYKNSEFYIEVISNAKDTSNRPAKIIIYGILNLSQNYCANDFSFEICQKILYIAQDFDRKLTEKQMDIIERKLVDIYHKNQKSEYIWNIIRMLFIAALPFLLFWIFNCYVKNINWTIAIFIISLNNFVLFYASKQ